MRAALAMAAALLAAVPLAAQQNAQSTQPPRDTTPPAAYYGVTEYQAAREKLERLMQPAGFTVYIIADMEGLAGAVRNATEMKPEARGGSVDHERFRQELTDEINAVIAGARAAGATQFVVNDGHGGTLFRNTLPWALDPAAILIRGYPKPIVMSTGLNPKVDAIMIVGAHANAGSPGVISHSYAFDSFTVNGKVLNETGIAAFIGGEMGVPLVLASGDDQLVKETREMLGPIEAVPTKIAYGFQAAAVRPLAAVHADLRAAAARAVRRTKAGALKPLTVARPYHVRFCLRRGYAADDWVRTTVSKFEGVTPDAGAGQGCFAYTTDSAEAVGNLLNLVEWTVLKP
ncbi:MAG TPA: M55 family metallopeptidase [Gemmatimonadales bacterium]|nr:M55 family metallopeptidase [Gemmatimonadales bacterium]